MTEHGKDESDRELDARASALSALLQTEDAGIQNSSQASMALIGIITAYLPVSIFAVYQQEFTPLLIAYLPWPVAFLMFYQMIMVAGTSRRARSAALIEERLVAIGGVDSLWQRGLIGSRARNPITNLYTIVQEKGDRWISRYIAALLPFLGLYALGIVYTFFMCFEASRLNPEYPQRFWAVIVPVLGSLLIWTVFADSAMSYFTPRYKINIWVPTAALAGVWLQGFQADNRTPLLLLFSVVSAVLVTIAAIARPFRPPGWAVIARSGLAGIIVATLAYWLLYVPFQGLRTDEGALWANLSMHLIVPVVLIAALISRRSPLQPMTLRQALAMMIFPLAYVAVLWGSWYAFGTEIPYVFLDPGRSPLPVFVLTCMGAAVIFVLAGLFEHLVLAIRGRPDHPD